MINSKIKIGVKGGNHYIVENNDNVEIVILDYDVEGVEEELLDKDELGNECLIDILQ